MQFEQDAVLAHELAHLKRRDHWVRRLEAIVLGLYWWYPGAWWARRQLERAEEECCDAWCRLGAAVSRGFLCRGARGHGSLLVRAPPTPPAGSEWGGAYSSFEEEVGHDSV